MKPDFYSVKSNQDIENSLFPKVLLAVTTAKKKHELRVFFGWATLSAFFSPVTYLLLSALHTKLIESSTFEYISLLVNDAEARSLYAKDILLAVYDTVPALGASLTLLSLVLVTVFYYKALQKFSTIAFQKQVAY